MGVPTGRRAPQVFVAVAAIAVLGLVAFPVRDRPVRTRTVAAAAPDPRPAELAARLDSFAARIERLGQLEKRLVRIEKRLVAVRRRPAVASGPEHARSLEELREHAKELSKDWHRRADAIDAWATIAEQARDPQRKAEAWFEQARISDWMSAAPLLRNVIETVGLENEMGQESARLLSHTENALGNAGVAMRIWRQLAATPGLPIEREVHVRMMLAAGWLMLGEMKAGIEEYDRVAVKFRDHPDPKIRKKGELAARIAANLRKQQE